MVENLHLCSEGSASLEGGILGKDHDVTNTGHVQLVQALNVETDVVTRSCLLDRLMMHLDGEYLSVARSGGGVSGKEKNLVFRLDDTLLDTTSNDISDTLDLVHTRYWHSQLGVSGTSGDLDHLLKSIGKSVDVDLLLAYHNVAALPPAHVGGLGDEVVTLPSRDRDNRDALGNEVLLPSDLSKHSGDFILDLSESVIAILSNITIHLVNTDDQLLDTQKVQQTGVLASLTLDLTGLVVTLSDGSNEVTISWNHEKSDISLRGTRNHVLDEISMARCVDDGVVIGVREEFLGRAGDSDTTSTLFLRLVHVESEGERILSKSLCLVLQLLHFSFRDATELEDQATGRGRLAGIDMSTDNNRNVLLTLGHCEQMDEKRMLEMHRTTD